MGIPLSTAQSLATVKGLVKTKTTAPEGRKVKAVLRSVVERTIPHLKPLQLADLVRMHLLMGCRINEVCIMRPCDLDRTDHDVWKYTPSEYKTEHKDERPEQQHYWIGPQGQAILSPWLATAEERGPEAWVFPTRTPTRGRGCYTKDSYGLAVAKTIRKVNKKAAKPEDRIPHWSPGQIRHLRLTEVKLAENKAGRHGGEGAQAVG